MTELERYEMLEVATGFVTVAAERELGLWSRFSENLKTAEAAKAEAAKDPFVEGSTGQLTEHPGFKVAARCDELALRLYRELTAGQDELIAKIAVSMR